MTLEQRAQEYRQKYLKALAIYDQPEDFEKWMAVFAREVLDIACKAVCHWCAEGNELRDVTHGTMHAEGQHVYDGGFWWECPAAPIRREFNLQDYSLDARARRADTQRAGGGR
jgi:hypothetical protein